jgi:hypothetical protein
MNIGIKTVGLAALCGLVQLAAAQEPAPPAKPTAQSEAGEPRASTSAPPAENAAPRSAKPAKGSPQADAGEPRADTSRAQDPAPTRGAANAAKPAVKSPGATDRLDLGTATVTGDREQPKVMYIVPWKRSDIGDLAGKPMNSLVDEILAPVDRDVFKREVVYYKAVQVDASQNGAPAHPSDQGEK